MLTHLKFTCANRFFTIIQLDNCLPSCTRSQRISQDSIFIHFNTNTPWSRTSQTHLKATCTNPYLGFISYTTLFFLALLLQGFHKTPSLCIPIQTQQGLEPLQPTLKPHALPLNWDYLVKQLSSLSLSFSSPFTNYSPTISISSSPSN